MFERPFPHSPTRDQKGKIVQWDGVKRFQELGLNYCTLNEDVCRRWLDVFEDLHAMVSQGAHVLAKSYIMRDNFHSPTLHMLERINTSRPRAGVRPHSLHPPGLRRG